MVHAPKKSRAGFSLLEMSIVVVVIGLIAGGLVAGQNMIRNAHMQALISDTAQYLEAMRKFKDKYLYAPGDFPGATARWGTNATCSSGGAGTPPQTCDGNGNGLVASYGSTIRETFAVWQHLANEGLIPGTYTGVGSNDTLCTVANCPVGRADYFYYVIGWSTSAYLVSINWDVPKGNYLLLGTQRSSSNYPAYPFLTASEAQAIDAKVDDGKPGSGVWIAAWPGYAASCVQDTSTSLTPDGSQASMARSVYVLTGSGKNCGFFVSMRL